MANAVLQCGESRAFPLGLDHSIPHRIVIIDGVAMDTRMNVHLQLRGHSMRLIDLSYLIEWWDAWRAEWTSETKD